jgi:hypothetical protein
MTCLRKCDYEGAVAAVHRFFDLNANSQQNQSELQYAVLNLALLHYAFGHIESCKESILETIRISLQNEDMKCVGHSLSLLYKVTLSVRDMNYASRILQRCISKEEKDGKTHMNWIDLASFLLETMNNEDQSSTGARIENHLETAIQYWLSDQELDDIQIVDNLTQALNVSHQSFKNFGSGYSVDLSLQIEERLSSSTSKFAPSSEKMGLLLGYAKEAHTQGNSKVTEKIIKYLSESSSIRDFPETYTQLLLIELSVYLASGNIELAQQKIYQIQSHIINLRAEFNSYFELSLGEIVLLVMRQSISQVILHLLLLS